MSPTTDCTRNLDIEIPSGEVEREYTRIAQGLQKRARIPGFRPGKAPLSLVRQHFHSKIREEVLETLVPAHLRAAFERENLDPVSTPTLDKLAFEPGAPLKFKASFEVLPAFEPGDYRAIRAEMPKVEVTPAEVEVALENLRQHHSRTEPSDAVEAADGLVAVVDAHRLAEGEASPSTPDEELSIEVGGPDTMPEFSAALRGMKPEEERDLEVRYPAEYPNAALAGQSRQYHLKLKRIQKRVLPELTDAFAKETTGAETVAELRQRIEDNLRAERAHAARHQVEEAVVDQLVGQAEFPVPQALVDKQIETKLERNLRNLARQGVDPRKLKLDWSKLRAQHQEAARREVKASLLLEKIGEREGIEASPEAVEAEVQRAATELGQTPEAMRARLTGEGVLDRIKNRIRQERVLEFLLENATGGGFASAARGGAAEESASR